MYSNQLIENLGLLNLKAKDTGIRQTPTRENIPDASSRQTHEPSAPASVIDNTTNHVHTQATETADTDVVKLDKNEFRLLVKMLQAIDHECTYDHISVNDGIVTYQHPNKTLVFNDINQPDSTNIMNLSSLAEILSKPELKRPVWEKLKQL